MNVSNRPAHWHLMSLGLLTLLFICIDRFLLLSEFSFQWVDDDQALLWNTAHDLLHGILREPRFYGQSYSTWLEALCAVPLLVLQFPYEQALPIATTLLSLTPFMMLAYTAARKELYFSAFFSLLMPLLITFELAMVMSMPRGFIPGLAVAALGAHLLDWGVEPQKPFTERRISAAFFLLTIAASVNPNAAPIAVMLGLVFLFRFFRERRLLLASCIGILLALGIHFAAQSFYWRNPDYLAHRSLQLEFSLVHWGVSLAQILNWLSAFRIFESPPWTVVLFPGSIILLALCLIRPTQRLAVLAVVFMLLLALGFRKLSDGSEQSIYQPLSRMFIAVPLFAAICLTWLDQRLNVRLTSRPLVALCVLTLLAVGCFRFELSRPAIDRIASVPEVQVQATRVSRLREYCVQIAQAARDYRAELVILNPHPMTVMAAYGCPALYKDFPPTIIPASERRTWRLYEESAAFRHRLLMAEYPMARRAPMHEIVNGIQTISANPLLSILTIQSQPPLRFLLHNRFRVRPLRTIEYRRWRKEAELRRLMP